MIKESDSLWDVPRLRKEDGRYWLVYHSYPGTGYESGPAEIGLAWCEDEELLDWHFPEKPVFSWKDGEEWEAGGLYKACIIENQGTWHMFYNAKDKEERWTEQTGMAFSEDLVHWTRCTDNPVLRVDRTAWDERFVSDPCIVKDGSLWINYYFGYGKIYEDGHTHAQEGLALSTDLSRWEKVREPILPYGAPAASTAAMPIRLRWCIMRAFCIIFIVPHVPGRKAIPRRLTANTAPSAWPRANRSGRKRRDDSIWNDWMRCCGEKPPAIYSLFSG